MPKLSIGPDVQVEQLTQWPKDTPKTPPEERENSRFKKPGILKRTLDDLEEELERVGAENGVLQLDLPPTKIRKRDGLPYVEADVEPPVVLSFENEEGHHTYPADTYGTWTENLRAIVYTLHDLRRIRRHGVGRGTEQYQGYTGIPSDVDERFGPEQAARKVVSAAGFRETGDGFDELVAMVLEEEEVATDYLRKARKNSHPDRSGGTAEEFKRVQMAGDVLRQHHGGDDS